VIQFIQLSLLQLLAGGALFSLIYLVLSCICKQMPEEVVKAISLFGGRIFKPVQKK
jgi:hypothetical protein